MRTATRGQGGHRSPAPLGAIINRHVRAQTIHPGMTIRHAGTWHTITSISLQAAGSAVRHGAAIYVADAVDSAGNAVRIQLHNDEYGYRLQTDRPTSSTAGSAPWQLRRGAPAFPNIR